MRIVVLNDKRSEREAMIRTLPAATYRAEAVADEHAAVAAIMREPPQIVVFSVPAKGGVDLVRRLKAVDASGQAYLIAVFDSAPSCKEIASILEAGVHDFVRRPVVEAELMGRLRAPERLMRWARSVVRPDVFGLFTPINVGALQAWKALGTLAATDFSQVVGQSFQVRSGWPAQFAGELHSATIPMSLAGDQLEIRLSIVVDATMLKWVKETLLGDPSASTEATDDVLRELCNTAGGALKRAAFCENVTLTTGIPSTDHAVRPPDKHACWTLTLDDGACLAVVGEIRTRENQRVAASALAEGMVLAFDVRNEGGMLLVPAGSRLTSTTAAKLAGMLGPRYFLEVAPAA